MALNVRIEEANEEQEAIAQGLLNQDRACGFNHTKSDALGEDERCYVICLEEAIIGYYSYRWVSNQIYYFFIAPEWRRRGIGATVVKLILENAAEADVKEVIVNMQPGSEKFWEAVLNSFPLERDWGSRFRVQIASRE
ncbi:GNAT family N-acetyltransferase [Pseudomonas protegens]|uniref:GNAT family N-acetyltransferase n=1 Tax=Pseudomonas protegens TaxID=380021 RepID=UPI00384DF614